MDEFISNLVMMVNTLGHKLFEKVKDNADSTNSEVWYINAARGAKAKGVLTQEGFVGVTRFENCYQYCRVIFRAFNSEKR